MRFRPLLGVATVLALTAAARADLIFLKDGFILHGKVKPKQTIEMDSIGKKMIQMNKGFFVDDGARVWIFPFPQVQDTTDDILPPTDTITTQKKIVYLANLPTPVNWGVVETTPFDDDWNRKITFRSFGGQITAQQHVFQLNSTYVQLVGTKYKWASFHLTRELGYPAVRALIADHPLFRDPPTDPPKERAIRRFRTYEFLKHAGWYEQASSELDGILRDLPDEKAKVEKERVELRKLVVQRHFDEVRKGWQAGRHQWVREQIPRFSVPEASQKAAAEFATIKTACTAADDKLREVKETLREVFKKIEGKEQDKLYTEAIKAIFAELHEDSVGRLDTFLDYARRAAKKEKAGGKPDLPPDDLLGLAVSGWVLGNGAAEAKFDTARRLWEARKAVQAYLQEENELSRKKILAGSLSAKDALRVDEVAQVLALLPPPAPPEKLPLPTDEQKVGDAGYFVRLPAEYHPARQYPVLIALHNGDEKPSAMLDRWASAAHERGFIVAAPFWGKGKYNFTPNEHAVVLDTLRDLRRKYQVDSDRVFLTGFGHGAMMAYDVGLSHPDLFAGVLPVCGSPEMHARKYPTNAQYLPFFIVNGDHMGEAIKNTQLQLEKWLPAGYPVLYLQYRGRGLEWFPAEVPNMLDWMALKKRNTPLTGLGTRAHEFKTHRPTDNRFYWLTIDAINPTCTQLQNDPASLHGLINVQENTVSINSMGVQQFTIWFGRDARIDFSKPLRLYVNGGRRGKDLTLEPSLEVLLEDCYQRGDRQTLFVAKLEVKP